MAECDKNFNTMENLLQILDALPTPVTLSDDQGRIIFYNQAATDNLDRKPEYIGRDIKFCHKKQESIDKIDIIMNDFRNDRTEEYPYRVVRHGRELNLFLRPIHQDGQLKAVVQTVIFGKAEEE